MKGWSEEEGGDRWVKMGGKREDGRDRKQGRCVRRRGREEWGVVTRG